jgi:maltose alpha-D-glucosyltransferase/alpha-amylase
LHKDQQDKTLSELNDRLWFKDAVFYEVYIRAFKDSDGNGHGDIPGLIEKLDYIKSLGVDCIWVQPHYASPLHDDGYDISDFYSVHPQYGTLSDFQRLIEAVHLRDMRIITDLVVNHTSIEHPWFQEARKGPGSDYYNYYVWNDTDQKYADTRIIFLDVEDSNWTFDEQVGQYYWHRFYKEQPDLNYDNPAVQEEMLNIVRFWLNMGLDGFRVDAVPYLFEREGTICENLPETHDYLKRMRAVMDEYTPKRLFLSEANQWPEDVREYFGEGDEVDMNFHFPIMPRIFKSLLQEDVSSLIDIEKRTPAIPENCQWTTFLRNHDELTLEMVTEEDRELLWDGYAPDPAMRQNLGIRRRLAPLLENNKAKILLANSLLFTMPGSPVIYYGDEIGMGDIYTLDDRNGVRTPMQWSDAQNAGFSSAPSDKLYSTLCEDEVYGFQRLNVAAQEAHPDSMLNHIRHMIQTLKKTRSLNRGDFIWEKVMENPTIAAYWRHYEDETMLIVQNVASTGQQVTLKMDMLKYNQFDDLISGRTFHVHRGNLELPLEPHQFHWLKKVS